jgi:hypothetical protein
MNHSVDERPEQSVCAQTSKESICEQRLSRNEIFLPIWTSLHNKETEEAEKRNEVEDKS